MNISITDSFKINKSVFDATGAFDAVLGIDTRLFIDPFLIPFTKANELKEGREKELLYFSNVLKLLMAVETKGDATWRSAEKLLKFHEVPGFNFGYSKKRPGSGFGDKLTNQILTTAHEIVRKGIVDPVIFELVGIFEEGIGCDRISDMICKVLFENFSLYTQRVFKDCKVDFQPTVYKGKTLNLPQNPTKPNEPILLVPKDILRDLPVAYDFDDIDRVCGVNEELREKMNSLLGEDWQKKVKGFRKGAIKKLFLDNPEFISSLLSLYKKSKPKFYDYKNDPSGEANWYDLAKKFTGLFPLKLTLTTNNRISELERVVGLVCKRFKDMVENNGLWEFFYEKDGKVKHERAAQLQYFSIADIYCDANDLALSREPNAGRGSVDFKVADGRLNLVVEIKWSTNGSLVHAYEKQLPIYAKAERSVGGIILVLKIKEKSNSLEALLERQRKDAQKRIAGPEIIIVDAMPKASASKA